MKRKKILLVTECWSNGGIESYICGLISKLSDKNVEIHLYATYGDKDSHLHILDKCNVKRTLAYDKTDVNLAIRRLTAEKGVKRLLQHGEFDIVHVHAMNGMELAHLESASKECVPIRIAHSHNSSFGEGFESIKGVAHKYGVRRYSPFATNLVACSYESGTYLFGMNPFDVVHNGIDVKRFTFDEKKRQMIRDQFCIGDDCLVLGSLGRVVPAKNPLFMIDILISCVKRHHNTLLLMVGSGELDEKVLDRANELGVRNRLLRISQCDNPEDYYSAMDVFILPSLYEGLPFTCIEAQCSGLPIWVSNAVPSESLLTPGSHSLPLSCGADKWADSIVRFGINDNRILFADLVEASSFSSIKSYDPILNIYGLGE